MHPSLQWELLGNISTTTFKKQKKKQKKNKEQKNKNKTRRNKKKREKVNKMFF